MVGLQVGDARVVHAEPLLEPTGQSSHRGAAQVIEDVVHRFVGRHQLGPVDGGGVEQVGSEYEHVVAPGDGDGPLGHARPGARPHPLQPVHEMEPRSPRPLEPEPLRARQSPIDEAPRQPLGHRAPRRGELHFALRVADRLRGRRKRDQKGDEER